MPQPNILYLPSHDTGRYVQPYGHNIPTPHIQALAEQGVLFRQNFCGGPTCSPSRAGLLTGQCAHSSGMLGLAHRGFSLRDYSQHLVHAPAGHGLAHGRPVLVAAAQQRPRFDLYDRDWLFRAWQPPVPPCKSVHGFTEDGTLPGIVEDSIVGGGAVISGGSMGVVRMQVSTVIRPPKRRSGSRALWKARSSTREALRVWVKPWKSFTEKRKRGKSRTWMAHSPVWSGSGTR